MLIQDQIPPKSGKPKPQSRNLPTLHTGRFSESKELDFSTWVSDNLSKLVVISLILATIASLFFVRNLGDAASSALLCFQSNPTHPIEKTLDFPQIDWNSIAPLIDNTTPFANFRSDKWIIVSVSDYPTDSIKGLVKIKGWQVVAVGNSRTPADWNLKGAIFLSLEMQSELGFRVLDYLPYDSYVRKSVGYLFAIQHGATKVFDADNRGDVIDGDLGKHFDLDLVGEKSRQEVILQYNRDNPNRSVVNPYIHFGQRSVWPRGLPLENVGEIGHEGYYTEVLGGNQFIQQGISNGLPDVDSVFYFTRKVGLESFDISFDVKAPKVALPQGVMVPVNSFNTLYHSSAFWGLMLPVSVSTMASDVMRGYWSQRLLWEIGGYVAVYPPTVHRHDKAEEYPFSDENDLHVNVGRLIKFLVSWRSSKNKLFEKILELSYAMGEERFWTEKDVKFTAAWLQDLVSVGYQQPRLMSLELDRPLGASKGRGDLKEFVPRKLPSVHLGVEEEGSVNYEIGNLIRWRRNLGNVVLIMFCTGPVERTALEWRLLYGRIFKTVIILSAQKSENLAVEQGRLDYLYKQLPEIMSRYTSVDGFLFLQDDTVLNYWNLLQADITKPWITNMVSESWTLVSATSGDWFAKQAEMVKNVVNTMPAHLQVNYKDAAKSDHEFVVCSSEVFFVPRRFVDDFVDQVALVGDLELHHKVATPMFFLSMDSPQNFDPVFNTMLYKEKEPTGNTTVYSAKAAAVHPWSVSTEQEFIKLVRVMSVGDPLLLELV